MRLIRGLHNLKHFESGCVATIGNFDGVHLGHQTILKNLKNKADLLNLPAVAITFEPLPREVFSAKNNCPPRLTRLREKLSLIKQQGIDYTLVLYFNAQLQCLSANNFIQNILVEKLNIQHLIVGDDFKFGAKRAGDFNLLQSAGAEHGFIVEATNTVSMMGKRISSTRVREALEANDMVLATLLLGRPFGFTGKVVHGEKRGRTIGYPTANLHLFRTRSPVHGVYITEILGLNNEGLSQYGIANVGNRPTFGGTQMKLEVHLLDFDGDLYGKTLTVQLLAHLRNEQKFTDFDTLLAQIKADEHAARGWLAENDILDMAHAL